MRKFLGIILFICLLFLGGISFNSPLFAEEQIIDNYNTTNYFNYKIYNETNFYTVNKLTNKIEHFNNNIVTTYGEYGNTDGKFTEIKFFKVLKNGEFVVLDNLNRLQFFDSNFNFIKIFQHIKNNTTFELLGNITYITEDIYSNVYLVDETHGYILKANSSMDNFEIVKNNLQLSNSKISYLNNLNEIVILQNNTLTINNINITVEKDCYEIFSDALNYIYLVCNDEILKFNTNLSEIASIELPKGSEYNINLENGKIYYFLNNKITVCENFASDISTFDPPVDINNPELLTSQIDIFTINNTCNLLKNPYSNECLLKLQSGDEIIKLASIQNAGIDFTYVLYLNNNTQFIGYLENKFLTYKTLTNTNYTVLPIRNDINYYKYPTNTLENTLQNKLIYNEQYTVTREILLDNCLFLEIKLDNNYIYVLNEEVLNTELSYVNLYFNTNAKLKLFGEETKINLYDNLNKDNIIMSFNKTTKVKVINNYNNLTEVEILINNTIYKGFVETKFVYHDEIYYIPLTIFLMIISILILIVLIIKFKKELTKRKQSSSKKI
ncbi:MAG: hypothetical protein E7359_00490 [Clostridiales bacterium]|nr:hypothetical protein [Clostridiales bacterium]